MSAEMPRKMPPFVYQERSRHGRVRFYFRRGKGKRVRLPDDLQGDDFRLAYEAALANRDVAPPPKSRVPSDTLQWLVERYMESGKWQNMAPSTRKQKSLLFSDAIKRGSNPAYRGITRRTMQKAMDSRAKTPALANNFLKAMRGLFKWAVKMEYIEIDPTEGVESFTYKTDGFKVWTAEDVDAFCAKWPIGSKPRLAFALYLVSGLRRSDVHRLGPQHLKDGLLSIRAAKPPHHLITASVPQVLIEIIDATPIGDMAFMIKDDGMPFKSKESFGNWFGARCREAGLENGKAAHGLRKLSATESANAGATTHELMARYGWSNPQQAEIYTRGADRKRLGIAASARMEERFADIMPRTLQPGEGKIAKKAE